MSNKNKKTNPVTANLVVTDGRLKYQLITPVKNILFEGAEKPFIKGKIYSIQSDCVGSTIYISEDNHPTTEYPRTHIFKSKMTEAILDKIDKAFVATEEKRIEAVDIDISAYKYAIRDGVIHEVAFNGCVQTTFDSKIDKLSLNEVFIFLGTIKEPKDNCLVKVKEYKPKTKIDCLKELYGDFEVEDLEKYKLKRKGFDLETYYINKNKQVERKKFYGHLSSITGESFYIYYEYSYKYNTEHYLADFFLLENCFKTKQEAINALLNQ
jgi:hypothetical protein